jgi:hypothetical protein
MSKIRRIVILILTGVITLLLFSLLAVYDYLYSYEQTMEPISYTRQHYIEFYIQSENRSALDAGLDVEEGRPFIVYACVMNFLGSQKNLTLAFGPAQDTQDGIYLTDLSQDLGLSNSSYRYDLTIKEGQYREFGLSLVPGPAVTTLWVAIQDGHSVLGARHCDLR